MTDLQIIAEIYGWYSLNDWQQQSSGTVQYPNPNPARSDQVLSFLPGYSYLTFKNDPVFTTYTNLFTVTSIDNDNKALLCLDQGLVVKKDIEAGGAFFSSQGAIYWARVK